MTATMMGASVFLSFCVCFRSALLTRPWLRAACKANRGRTTDAAKGKSASFSRSWAINVSDHTQQTLHRRDTWLLSGTLKVSFRKREREKMNMERPAHSQTRTHTQTHAHARARTHMTHALGSAQTDGSSCRLCCGGRGGTRPS